MYILSGAVNMNQQDKLKLQQNRTAIVKDLDVKSVLDQLYADGIISSEDFERINAEKTTQDRCRYLLDMLPSKGPRAFSCFRESLQKDTKWLADLLS